MKRLLFLNFFILLSTLAFSQASWKYGPTFGVGPSDVYPYYHYYDEDYKMLLGYRLGFEASIRANDNVLFRTQLCFASSGTYVEGYSSSHVYQGSTKARISYLDLPVLLSIDFGKPEGFLLTFGLHGSLGLGGKKTVETSNGDIINRKIVFLQSDNRDALTYRTYSAGWNFGIGIKKDNVIFDVVAASTFERETTPVITTINGSFSIMVNHISENKE